MSLSLCVLLAVSAGAQDDRFRNWDKNGDGKLSREELPERLRRNFDRVDANRDGSISLEEHRAAAQRLAERTAQRGGPARSPDAPEGVIAKRDIPYAGTDNPRQKLDLYLPKEPKGEKLPLIVFIHGGAWRAGDKNGGLQRVAPFVQSGQYAGASIGYRLTNEAQWPAQIHDCKAAIRWLRANAKEHKIDPERIAVWGSSAGGHLVAMLCVSGNVKELEGELGKHLGTSSRVTCVVDFFGPTELLTMGDAHSKMDHNSADSPESRLIGGALQENKEKAKAASPITYVTRDDAPILIMHGTKDPLVPYDQSVRFEKALKKAGVDVLFVTVQDGGHGFRGAEIDKRVAVYFEKYLRGQDVEISLTPIPSERRR